MTTKYWIGPIAGYHEGDQQPGDVQCPQQPDDTYDWNGTAWVIDAERQAAKIAAVAAAQGASLAMSAILADPTIQFLMTHQPQECYTAVQAQIIDLPTAKDMIGKLAMALCALVRIQAGSVDNAS